MPRLRLGVLISGRGSNLQALIDACADPAYPAEIVSVISDRAEAPGLAIATAAGISGTAIRHRDRFPGYPGVQCVERSSPNDRTLSA